MIITTQPFDVKSLGLGGSSGVRASGLHASDLYNDLYRDLEPKKYGRYDKSKPPDPLLVEIGLIFENMLEEGLKRRIEANGGPEISRPGEFTFRTTWDDRPVEIHYNPDLFIFNGILRIGEIKSTWMWSGMSHEEIGQLNEGDPEMVEKHRSIILDPKYDKYHTQLKFYCYMQGTRFARLYIFYVTANGRPSFPAQLPPPWDIEYTEDELESNFAMLMNHGLMKGML